MIYLRSSWDRVGLTEPASVAIWVDGPPWVAAQALEEMALLFPDAKVAITSTNDGELGTDIPDLAVLVSGAGAFETGRQLAWMEVARSRATLALALYTMAPRRFEVVPVACARDWARKRRLTNFLLRWRRRWARAWRYAGAICASSS